jgi:hypothetical protein
MLKERSSENEITSNLVALMQEYVACENEDAAELLVQIQAIISEYPQESIESLCLPGLFEEDQQLLVKIICNSHPASARSLFDQYEQDSHTNIDLSLILHAYAYLKEIGR